MTNRCPVCNGLGRVLAFGVAGDPITMRCPECAGLAVPPASADDPPGPAAEESGGTETDAA